MEKKFSLIALNRKSLKKLFKSHILARQSTLKLSGIHHLFKNLNLIPVTLTQDLISQSNLRVLINQCLNISSVSTISLNYRQFQTLIFRLAIRIFDSSKSNRDRLKIFFGYIKSYCRNLYQVNILEEQPKVVKRSKSRSRSTQRKVTKGAWKGNLELENKVQNAAEKLGLEKDLSQTAFVLPCLSSPMLTGNQITIPNYFLKRQNTLPMIDYQIQEEEEIKGDDYMASEFQMKKMQSQIARVTVNLGKAVQVKTFVRPHSKTIVPIKKKVNLDNSPTIKPFKVQFAPETVQKVTLSTRTVLFLSFCQWRSNMILGN